MFLAVSRTSDLWKTEQSFHSAAACVKWDHGEMNNECSSLAATSCQCTTGFSLLFPQLPKGGLKKSACGEKT